MFLPLCRLLRICAVIDGGTTGPNGALRAGLAMVLAAVADAEAAVGEHLTGAGGQAGGSKATPYSLSSFTSAARTFGFCGGFVIPRGGAAAYCTTGASGRTRDSNQALPLSPGSGQLPLELPAASGPETGAYIIAAHQAGRHT